MEKKKNVTSTSNYRFKTMICNSFKEKGRCPYGDKCQFAHGNDEMRDVLGSQSNYKTKRCQKFWNAGYCAYGSRCNFLHFEEEADDQVKRKHFSGKILDQLSRTIG